MKPDSDYIIHYIIIQCAKSGKNKESQEKRRELKTLNLSSRIFSLPWPTTKKIFIFYLWFIRILKFLHNVIFLRPKKNSLFSLKIISPKIYLCRFFIFITFYSLFTESMVKCLLLLFYRRLFDLISSNQRRKAQKWKKKIFEKTNAHNFFVKKATTLFIQYYIFSYVPLCVVVEI